MGTERKICQNCKNSFTIEPADFKFYEKIAVPSPTFCPECRLIRRLAWRNERSLYSRNCDKCKKQMVSIYSPDKELTVYCSPCWWSDDWDAMDYGMEFDPQKPFLVQLHELLRKVPMMNLHGLYTTNVNSDYAHMVSYLKNCYMVTYADVGENLMYGSFVNDSKDSVDNLMLDHGELCYETVNCSKCYQVFFSVDCEQCNNVFFSKNCMGCSDCFGCVNLRNKRYHIFNKPYSKEAYEKFMKDITPFPYKGIEENKEKAFNLWKRFPQKYMHGRNNVNVSGEYIHHAKNVHDSFLVANAEHCRFCMTSQGPLKDSYDFSHFGIFSELLYEGLQCGDHVSNIRLSWWVITNSRDVEYSMYLVNCSNVFGSIGLKRKKYCILNKQYTKESFEKLRAQIIKQMNEMPYFERSEKQGSAKAGSYKDKQGNAYKYGEFFPIEMSLFGYNETTAQEMFPLTQKEAKVRGYSWKEAEQKTAKVTVTSNKLPEEIKDVPDSIINEVIGCEHAGPPAGGCNESCTIGFRIIPAELKFYRQMNLPLPRLCMQCRHYQRLQFRNSPTLWHRKCNCAGAESERGVYKNTVEHFHKSAHCPNEFETSYFPQKKDIVYCEKCYLTEVA